eukprot:Gregarina_sp_Poly_1__3458@NODE_2000_length_2891_cov_7_838527_g1291_i0_p2_GENE_NODE_2000_length_2891_cov_7_838527_g1291_i0NODE_2000_length_2891_cov_7_838527_g1291_i0_p2_ORF_typecomplete_len127_score11_20DUF4187/PF13821_6/0_21_NODE_2000_length_2891_cov_7_838527_g1291_i014331813
MHRAAQKIRRIFAPIIHMLGELFYSGINLYLLLAVWQFPSLLEFQVHYYFCAFCGTNILSWKMVSDNASHRLMMKQMSRRGLDLRFFEPGWQLKYLKKSRCLVSNIPLIANFFISVPSSLTADGNQ